MPPPLPPARNPFQHSHFYFPTFWRMSKTQRLTLQLFAWSVIGGGGGGFKESKWWLVTWIHLSFPRLYWQMVLLGPRNYVNFPTPLSAKVDDIFVNISSNGGWGGEEGRERRVGRNKQAKQIEPVPKYVSIIHISMLVSVSKSSPGEISLVRILALLIPET